MQILMIKSREGSPDGKSIRLYQKGHQYIVPQEISEDLAKTFVRERWAKNYTPDNSNEDSPQKDSGFLPETKDLGKAPKNKKKGDKSKIVKGNK